MRVKRMNPWTVSTNGSEALFIMCGILGPPGSGSRDVKFKRPFLAMHAIPYLPTTYLRFALQSMA